MLPVLEHCLLSYLVWLSQWDCHQQGVIRMIKFCLGATVVGVREISAVWSVLKDNTEKCSHPEMLMQSAWKSFTLWLSSGYRESAKPTIVHIKYLHVTTRSDKKLVSSWRSLSASHPTRMIDRHIGSEPHSVSHAKSHPKYSGDKAFGGC